MEDSAGMEVQVHTVPWRPGPVRLRVSGMGLVSLRTCGRNQASFGIVDAPQIIGESLETGHSPIWRLTSRSGEWNDTISLSPPEHFLSQLGFLLPRNPAVHPLRTLSPSFFPTLWLHFSFPSSLSPSTSFLSFLPFSSSHCLSLIGHDRELEISLLLVEFLH